MDIDSLPKKLRLFIYMFAGLILFSALCYMLLLKVSFTESLGLTFETLAFIFHEEAGIATLEVFLAIFGVFIVWWILWSAFDIIFGDSFQTYWHNYKTKRLLKMMKDHYIIAGGGRVGIHLASALQKKGIKAVVIEHNEKKMHALKSNKIPAVLGEVTEKAVMQKAGIDKAKVLIVALPEAEKNILVTLMGKELNPNIEVYARADNPEFVDVLHRAGAKKVFVPELTAADAIINSLPLN